ncbi:MAG: sulfonate transport system substrate-binding protein [Acidimicrobiaceae bacterium]|nr:sulfonate transport system substrate-binding protein [Acidimicrobiaceae bacterium]
MLVPLVALFALGTACGDNASGTAKASTAKGSTEEAPTTVRLGYFPNITHATAIVGVESGIFTTALGRNKLETQTFNAGPAAVEALLSGALDASYIGPNPAINAYVKSSGKAIRIISGATSGGAALVVKPGVTTAADLKGKKVASPQLGGTQDVALRHWLKDAGLNTDPQGGGDVSIVPQENAQTLETFKSGAISGAWVPEPWATRLVQEGGGKVLVNEAELWPGGRFVTTHLVVRTDFLKAHPAAVRALLDGQVKADALVHDNPSEAQKLVNTGIEKITGKKLAEAVITGAWPNLEFTNDPVASSLKLSADHAKDVGLLPAVRLDGIYDLALLNQALKAAGQPQVRAS